MNYPEGPTYEARVDSTKYNSELIGENEFGRVYLHGPFGDMNSDVKIAYLIGMHPLESKSHRALFEKLTNNNDLSYCYYLYNIEVFDVDSDSEGRNEGQFLARDFAKPHIINEKYDLFLDIHSNRGSHGPGDYQITNFLFAPGFDEKSSRFMDEIIEKIDGVIYYAPEFRSSPPFITEPVANAGIPTVVYECYSYEDMSLTYDLADKLVKAVDGLIF